MSPAERSARILLQQIGQAERTITCAAFFVLIVVLFADVVARETTGAGLIWARQIGVYANLFLTMIGIGIASADAAHLRPRFADQLLPLSWEPFLERLQEALMAAFCLVFAIVAGFAVHETWVLEESTAMPRWAVWPFQLVLPIVFLIACLRHGLFACLPRLRPRSGALGLDADAEMKATPH